MQYPFLVHVFDTVYQLHKYMSHFLHVFACPTLLLECHKQITIGQGHHQRIEFLCVGLGQLTCRIGLDIDHFVPLSEAWKSGAWRWNASTREAYANDLGYPLSLIAVTASTNRQKSDSDPAEWMPPFSAYRCTYVSTWIAVKWRWRLTADPLELAALRLGLTGCGRAARVPTPTRATIALGPPTASPPASSATARPAHPLLHQRDRSRSRAVPQGR